MTKLKMINEFNLIMEPALHLFPTHFIYLLDNEGFFSSPASKKHYGNYEGGLFEHSYNVTKILIELTSKNDLKWLRSESPYIIGMFHDLCKIDQYKYNHDESRWDYNEDAVINGHGEKSVMLLSRYLSLTMEEILCIRYHMGAFSDKKEWDKYSKAIHKYDTVLWTHHADMIASHIVESATLPF